MNRGVATPMVDKPSNQAKKRSSMDRERQRAWEALQENDFQKAEKGFLKAVALAKELSDPAAHAVLLFSLGLAKQGLQQYEAASHTLREAAAIAREHGFARVEAHACLVLGQQEHDAGQSEVAIQHYLRGLEAADTAEDTAALEALFGNLGWAYLYRGWAEQAADWFRQALEVFDDSEFRCSWLGGTGLALAELGQYDAAIGCYRESFEDATSRDNVSAQAISKGSEGNALFELGDMAGALECYEQAVEFSRAIDDQRRVATWLGNIGNTWLRRGDVTEAIRFCEEAVETAKAIGDIQAQAGHLDSVADCYMARGELNLAMDNYLAALSLSTNVNDKLGERIYLSNIGRAFEQMGQLQPAFDHFVRAIDLFDAQRSAIKADDLKTTFANRGQDLYRDMVKVCLAMGKRVDALEFVGRSKSRALLDLLSNSPIDISQLADDGDNSLRKLIGRESELRNQIAGLERLFWQGPAQGESGHRGATMNAEESHKLYAEWRDTINQLRRRHPNYAGLVAATTLTFREIISLWEKQKSGQADFMLDRDTAILEFYCTDQYVMAASVWHGGDQPMVHTILDETDKESLEADILSFLEMSATEGWEVPLSLCKRLYKGLMHAIISALPPNINNLLIVPHGNLYHLPFAALHDGTGYLCERFSISYLPTTSLIPVLANTESNQSEGAGYLISAISDYSATRENGITFSARLRSAAGLEDLSHTME